MVPSTDAVVEWDFKNTLPRNVSFHTARMQQNDSTKRCLETLDEICAGIVPAASSLVQVNPEVVLFACTAAGFHRGHGWDDEVSRRIKEVSYTPVIVAVQAARDALRSINAKRIAILAPYSDIVTELEVAYFERAGIEVANRIRLGCSLSRELADISLSALLEHILENAGQTAECDALFVSCTGIRSMEVVPSAEDALGIPVVTSNSACLWSVLRFLGESGSGYATGRLFSLGVSTS